MIDESPRKAIATNTVAQLVGKAIATGSSLLTTILIANTMGPAYYGEFTKSFVTATLFFVSIDFGINAVIVRRMDKEGHPVGEEFRNALGTRLVLASASLIALAAFLVLLPLGTDRGYSLEVKVATLIFGLTFFEQATVTTINSIFQKRLEYQKAALATAVGSLVILVGVALAVAHRANLAAVAAAYVAGSVGMMLVATLLVKRVIGRVTPTFQFLRMRQLLWEAFPIGATLILNLTTTRLGTIILALLRTSEEVGYYGLAFRVFDVVLVFPTFLMNATYPILLKRVKRGPHAVKSLFWKMAALLFVSSLAGSALLLMTSPFLSVVREEFRAAQPILSILSLSLPFFFLTSLTQWTLVVFKRETILIPSYGAALGLNLILNLFLIPRYGSSGAAVTTGISEAVVLLVTGASVLQSFRSQKRRQTQG